MQILALFLSGNAQIMSTSALILMSTARETP